MKTKNKFICIHKLSQVSNKKIQSRLSFSPCLNFTLSQIKYVRLYLTGCCFNRFSKKSLNCFLEKFYFIFSNSHDFGVTSKGIKSLCMNSIQGSCVFKVQPPFYVLGVNIARGIINQKQNPDTEGIQATAYISHHFPYLVVGFCLFIDQN